MNILAFCCALNNSYLALSKDFKIDSKIIKSDENYHSLYLLNEIKTILENNKLKFNDINLIAVNTGPGSFTGIRVALTIARIMASELSILAALIVTYVVINSGEYSIITSIENPGL